MFLNHLKQIILDFISKAKPIINLIKHTDHSDITVGILMRLNIQYAQLNTTKSSQETSRNTVCNHN